MFGNSEALLYPVYVLVAIGAVTDIVRGRIYNWLTLSGMALGIVAMTGSQGISGLTFSLLGIGAGLVLYGWLFWLGIMGGGDVKLLMAIGAWSGARSCFEI